MKIFYLICFLTGMVFVACKPNDSTTKEEAPATNAPVTQNGSTIAGGHDYTFLTDQLFHYDAVNIIGKEPGDNPYKNQWIDLLPDGTYKSGTLQQQGPTGKWDYNHDKRTLVLRPDDSNSATSEWTVMHNNDMMVWVGTQTFGNNATQIKLVRRTEFPQG